MPGSWSLQSSVQPLYVSLSVSTAPPVRHGSQTDISSPRFSILSKIRSRVSSVKAGSPWATASANAWPSTRSRAFWARLSKVDLLDATEEVLEGQTKLRETFLRAKAQLVDPASAVPRRPGAADDAHVGIYLALEDLIDAPGQERPHVVVQVMVDGVVVGGICVSVPVIKVQLGNRVGQIIIDVEVLLQHGQWIIAIAYRIQGLRYLEKIVLARVVSVVLIKLLDAILREVGAVLALVQVAVVLSEVLVQKLLVIRGFDDGVYPLLLVVHCHHRPAGSLAGILPARNRE